MSQPLPYKDLQFVQTSLEDVLATPDDADVGYAVKCCCFFLVSSRQVQGASSSTREPEPATRMVLPLPEGARAETEGDQQEREIRGLRQAHPALVRSQRVCSAFQKSEFVGISRS